VEIARSAAPRAYCDFSRQLCLGTGCERGNFLVSDMKPLDIAAPAHGIRQAVQAVANDPVDAFYARGREYFN
jgi:hypothetical protein